MDKQRNNKRTNKVESTSNAASLYSEEQTQNTKEEITISLDISTSVCGVAAFNNKQEVVILEGIKIPKTFDNLFDKAEFAFDKIKALTSNYKIKKIYVEENAKAFAMGKTSAQTIIQLAKINCLISYITKKHFGCDLSSIHVSTARKLVGFKKDSSSKKSIKDQVFDYITISVHPTFPWKTKLVDRGRNKGLVCYTDEMKDACDALVILKAGLLLNP